MKKEIAAAFFSLLTVGVFAQDKKQQDIKSIKSMCGCYEVEYNFAETFRITRDPNYKPSKTETLYGLEWAELVEDTPNKIVLQHLLIVDTLVIKHWRQDWEYESTKRYDFDKDKSWKFRSLAKNDVKGKWTQKVYNVDDSPRYAGTATWLHVDGRDFWTSTTDAPLPRREYSIRSDYNVLKRTNTQEITKTGWIHNQDNVKVVRDDTGKDKILADEKGYDVYTKVPDSRCQKARDFWAKNKTLWKNVRDKWQTIYDRDQDLNLEAKVDNQQLFDKLFSLEADTPKSETDKIIESFVKK